MDYRTDNDWVYRSYNLISRILILAAVDNVVEMGRKA